MSVTTHDARLLGAERAEALEDFVGSGRTALLVVSPETGQVVLWDRMGPLRAATALHFADVRPRRAQYDAVRQEVWVFGDSGVLVRLAVSASYAPLATSYRATSALLDQDLAITDAAPAPSTNVYAIVQLASGRMLAWSQTGQFVWWSDDEVTSWTSWEQIAWAITTGVYAVVGLKDGVETVLVVDANTTRTRWASTTPPLNQTLFAAPMTLENRPGVTADGEFLLVGSDGGGQGHVARYVGSDVWQKATVTYNPGFSSGNTTVNMVKLPSGRYVVSMWSYDEKSTFVRYSDDFVSWSVPKDFQSLGTFEWAQRVLYVHPVSGRLVGIVYAPGVALAVRYSDDGGDTWSAGSAPVLPVDTYLVEPRVLVWDGQRMILSAFNGTTQYMLVSADGAAWTLAATYGAIEGSMICVLSSTPEAAADPALSELASATVAKPNMARWLLQVQSAATEDRRISTSAAHLIREENTDLRIIDQRSHRLLVLPVAAGTIGVVDTEVDGVALVSVLSGMLPTEAAAFADGLIYLADSGGLGAVVEVQHDGSLQMLARFALPKVQGPLDARAANGKLYILCERRNRLLRFDLSDPLLPVLEADTTYDQGLYWERNPVRVINRADQTAIRKFGFDPTLLDHGDLPVSDAGDGWALHGEIAALTVED